MERGQLITHICRFPWKPIAQHTSDCTLVIHLVPFSSAPTGKPKQVTVFLDVKSFTCKFLICKPSVWLSGPGWLFSYGTGIFLNCLYSSYRPYSAHIFAFPAISLNWWNSIHSSSAKFSTQDDRNIGYPLVIFIQSLMCGWKSIRKSGLKPSEKDVFLAYHNFWDCRTPPLSQWDEAKISWRCFREARGPDHWVSDSLAHTGE